MTVDRRVWISCTVIAIGALFLLAYSQLLQFTADTITYGILDAARHVAEGRGLKSHVIPVSFLPYFADRTLPLPYLWYPLLPYLTGLLFEIFGPVPYLVRAVPIACYLMSGLLVAEIGRRVFDERIGVIAAIVLLSHPFMFETAMRENFTDTLLVASMLGCVLAIASASDRGAGTRSRLTWLLGAGVLLGLCQYARSAALVLYLPIAAFTWMAIRQRAWTAIATILATAVAVQVPLFAFNIGAVGSPTFTPAYILLLLSDAYPGYASITALLPTSTREVLALYPAMVLKKWLGQVWVHYKYFFTFMSPVLLVGALLAAATSRTPKQRALVVFTAVLLAVMIPFNSLIYWDNRYLLPAVPFIILIGLDAIRTVLSLPTVSGWARVAVMTVCAVFIATEPLDFFYQSFKTKDQYPPLVAGLRDYAEFLKSEIREGDVVMAQEPGIVGWEVDVPAVALAHTPDIAKEVKDRYFPYNVLVLEVREPRADVFGYSRVWFEIASGKTKFGGFEPVASRTVGGLPLVILRDAARATPLR